ncbi:MAG TPA: thiamine pyrophosphate-dependent dehydrogenase E1 component subunit alpha [Anaerolineales bacterium]|nr:thiamine pyrophosphate-dependent dehydrogenase E1 component subunit alpha [Anaerolineales bacterium]
MTTHSAHHADLYRRMLRIRRFEETVLDSFTRGLLHGTTHTYIGQEANAVGVLAWREQGDVVVSNHRCHGHFLAYGGGLRTLAAELMGRATGVCGGRGGSQHIHWQDFYSSGILGGTLPLAVGMAFAEKAHGLGRIVFVFLGDGALGEGAVYESLNMASLWHLPLLIALENNGYAQSTPIRLSMAGEIALRFRAFGIPCEELDTTDVLEIRDTAGAAATSTRSGAGPHALILNTYRFSPHSKGDDTRDPQEIARYRARDPLPLHAARLVAPLAAQLAREVEEEVADAFRQAAADPFPDPSTITAALEPAA